MKIDKTGRDSLKVYFAKNAVPTAANFEELIAAALNQRDDGIAKQPGEPLSLQADGDDTSQKKLLNFYRNFNDAQPAWTLALSPRGDPRNPATGRNGLGITDGAGAPRLFIDQATGFVGVGTVTPGARLDVAGSLRVASPDNQPRDPESRLDAPGTLALKSRTPQIDFIDAEHTDWAIHVNSHKMYFIREPWIFTDLVLDGAGNIGMGCDNPRAKLEVRGGAIMPSFGAGTDAGLRFPSDAAGGAGDNAWLRYYSRGGESCTLELGISNDADDHIALMAAGGVGIGTNNPIGKLHVQTGGVGTWDRFIVTTTNFWGDGNNQHVCIGAGGAAGIMFHNPHVVWQAADKRASIRMGRSGGVADGHWWDIGVRPGNEFSIVDGHNGQFGLSISETGVVKINTLLLGNKWRFSAVGDYYTSDEWLRMCDPNNKGYSGGFAAGKMWTNQGQYLQSDARSKTDIATLQSPLDCIARLRGVTYRWKDGAANAAPVVGLIAQEVEAVLPEAVTEGPDGLKGVNYAVLVAPLIEAVKQQQAQIAALAAQLAALRPA
jgi:hypothetical protein